jgi:hypothetical protein
MFKFFFEKKSHRVVKAPFKEGRWDIIKGIHSIHSAQWQTSFIKRTELPHLLIIQMPLVLIKFLFYHCQIFIPTLSSPTLLLLAFTPQSPLLRGGGGGERRLGEGSSLLLLGT